MMFKLALHLQATSWSPFTSCTSHNPRTPFTTTAERNNCHTKRPRSRRHTILLNRLGVRGQRQTWNHCETPPRRQARLTLFKVTSWFGFFPPFVVWVMKEGFWITPGWVWARSWMVIEWWSSLKAVLTYCGNVWKVNSFMYETHACGQQQWNNKTVHPDLDFVWCRPSYIMVHNDAAAIRRPPQLWTVHLLTSSVLSLLHLSFIPSALKNQDGDGTTWVIHQGQMGND